MKRLFDKLLVSLGCVLLLCVGISAQSNSRTNQKLFDEITMFRQKLSSAIKKQDRKALETMFADDFTHTHAVGRVDDKEMRINAILTGDKTLEAVVPDEIKIRFYGENTAIAVGKTTIDETVYRWTMVYVKIKKDWKVAASQASKTA